MFSQLLEKERFCDVTLYCSPSFTAQLPENGTTHSEHIRGESLRAHRVVLAACSDLLATLLAAHESQGEPVVVIDGAEPKHVRQLLDYMYTGEMNVHHSQLASLLKTAEELRIKGLTDIRWNNKDEPPDCQSGAITATSTDFEKQIEKNFIEDLKIAERLGINGGPPPLIKIPKKEKLSPNKKRENSDTDTQSPKRQRLISQTDVTDDDEKEWQHGNLDITAERVVNWGAGEQEASAGSWEKESDEEWPDATDIGSFLHTNLRVDGDNSGDEESGDCATSSASASGGSVHTDLKCESVKPLLMSNLSGKANSPLSNAIKSSGNGDPRFNDVIKLNEYLLHGRRPQFWEEEYVKRVMEMVRLKELEMKQAAEILGVSYGTLYGRYRDVYGCINRPYRIARNYWHGKRPSEVLNRLQRQEITLDVAASALGVSVSQLAGYCSSIAVSPSLADDLTQTSLSHDEAELPFAQCTNAQFGKLGDLDFELLPVKCELEKKGLTKTKKLLASGEATKKLLIGNLNDEEIPTTMATNDDKNNTSPKLPNIRIASIDSLRSGSTSSSTCESASTSPTLLMKSRPDLTIVAAKKETPKEDESAT